MDNHDELRRIKNSDGQSLSGDENNEDYDSEDGSQPTNPN